MTNKKLAEHYGVTLSAVNKWSKEKRAALIREIESGVNPEVRRLIGELAQLCYVAQCKKLSGCYVETYLDSFSIWANFEYFIYDAQLNALALQGAIAELEVILND